MSNLIRCLSNSGSMSKLIELANRGSNEQANRVSC